MIADDPLLAELEAANPIPRTSKPGTGDRIEADRVLRRVLSTPPRRRRSWTVLAPVASALVVIVVIAVALGVGGKSGTSGSAGHNPQIVLQAEPTPQTPVVTPAALSRTVAIIRRRLDAVAPGFKVNAAGGDRIVIAGHRAGAAEQARIATLASQTAQLHFYDWEANVLTPDGKTVASQLATQDPTAIRISQGAAGSAPGAAAAGGMSLYDAVSLAARQPHSSSPRNGRQGPEYFLFGAPGSTACATVASARGAIPTAGEHCLLAGPVSEAHGASRPLVIRELAAQLPPGVAPSDGRLLTVPQGTVVLQAQSPAATAFSSPEARFFVLRDEPVLSTADVAKPRVSTDAGGNPDVEFGFTAAGARRFQALTAQVSHRGQTVSTLGMTLDQHFAIALDGRLLTVPSIDYRIYPDGITTTSQGADVSGLTAKSARDLAVELRSGTLPLSLVLPLRIVH